MRVTAYLLHILTPTEKNYHHYFGKLEFLGLKWAICDHFRNYLCYALDFTVYTDNKTITYILSSAKLKATCLPWMGKLADFHFNIKYRPGIANTDADALPLLLPEIERFLDSDTEETKQETIHEVTSAIQVQEQNETDSKTALTVNHAVLDEELKYVRNVTGDTISLDGKRTA